MVDFTKKGLLPVGVHHTTWEEFQKRFAITTYRQNLLSGLQKCLAILQLYGCTEIYIGGSFVTDNLKPNDIDVCYNNAHMNWKKFIKDHPEFNDSKNGSAIQKAKYQSEFYAFNSYEDYILRFFQFDKNNNPKGIVKISLSEKLL